MPMVSCGSGCTVHRDTAAKVPLAVYLVAFVGMGALAYWKGMPTGTPGPCSAQCPAAPTDATAVVWIRRPGAAADDLAGPAAGLSPVAPDPRPAVSFPDPQQVRQQVLALADQGQREQLLVETTAEAAAGAWKVSITLRNPNGVPPAEQTVRDVNALAGSDADTYRAEWKVSVDRAYEGARAATERAAEQLRQAQGQLDAVLDRQIQAVREASQRLQPPPAPALPAPVENPDWTELNRQLSELLGRRSELLASRTPQHPVVQDVEARIDTARQRLALVSRYMPGAASPPAVKMETAAAAVPSAALADPVELEGLQRAVEGAGRAHHEAVRVERLAGQARLREPTIDVELAAEPPSPRRWPFAAMALLGALATGLTMVVGLGMISAGSGIEPPLGTARELQAAARAPVVGVVPGDAGQHEPASRAARLRLLRWTLMLLGSLALSGSLVMLWYVHPT